MPRGFELQDFAVGFRIFFYRFEVVPTGLTFRSFKVSWLRVQGI